MGCQSQGLTWHADRAKRGCKILETSGSLAGSLSFMRGFAVGRPGLRSATFWDGPVFSALPVVLAVSPVRRQLRKVLRKAAPKTSCGTIFADFPGCKCSPDGSGRSGSDLVFSEKVVILPTPRIPIIADSEGCTVVRNGFFNFKTKIAYRKILLFATNLGGRV